MATEIDPADVLGGKRILMVDDRPASLAFLRAALTRATRSHVEISERESLSDAVAALREKPDRFDMVVIDLHIPGKLPAELEPYRERIDIDLNEGQALGLWLQEHLPKKPYVYLSAVPEARTSSSGERPEVEVLSKIDSAKAFPRRLAEVLRRCGDGFDQL